MPERALLEMLGEVEIRQGVEETRNSGNAIKLLSGLVPRKGHTIKQGEDRSTQRPCYLAARRGSLVEGSGADRSSF